MAKGSSKKPSDPKCRGCSGLLEGRQLVQIGGSRWHVECAEKSGKHIPREAREPREKAEPVAVAAAPAEVSEAVEAE